MKRALCIAVSIAVMVVFSFADVMAITKAPDEGTNPDEVVSEEDIAADESAGETPDEVIVEEPSGEETDAVTEESEAEPEVTAKAIEGVTLSATPGDGKVDLEWSAGEDATDITFTIKNVTDSKTIKENVPAGSCPVEGLTNGKKYVFEAVATNGVDDPITKTAEATPKAVAPGKVTELNWSSDSASVDLTWKPVAKADGYVVERDGVKIFKESGLKNKNLLSVKETSSSVCWRVKAMERKGTSLATYKFSVQAFRYKDPTKGMASGNLLYGDKATKDKCYPVRAIYATFTPKKTGYAYTSAKGKKKGMKLKKGKKYIAKGFVCSRYRVCEDSSSGKVYFYPRVLGKNGKFLYNKKGITYSAEEAQNFVNHKGLKSKGKGKNYLVWISLYTQHVYFFKGSKGNWKVIKHWEVSTGKLQSATATGTWKIFRHWKHRRGLSYWSNFYSQVAMHSWGNSSCFGAPHSGGCVRMKKSQAKWVYNTMPMGTTVYVY